VEVQVLSADKEKKKIALSLKRAGVVLSLRQVDEADPVVTIKDAPLEESSATIEEATSTKAGEPGGNITFSLELLECIHRAMAIAKRMRSELVQPEHLLLGVLQNERIQNSLAPWLPSPEVLSNPTIIVDFTGDEQTRLSACPFCGRSVQPHWKHCVYCGASLARTCPHCGALQPGVEDAQYCFECGSPLEQKFETVPGQVIEKREKPETKTGFTKGQRVRVLDGPFTEYIGTVVDIDTERSKVTVLVSFFGRKTPVVLDFPQVEKI